MTLTHTIGSLLGAYSRKLAPPAAPTLADVRRQQLHEAEFALLDAENNAERWIHTVDLMRARCARLRGNPSP